MERSSYGDSWGNRMTPFMAALARDLGGLLTVELSMREARACGALAVGARGRSKVWSVDDIAAIIAAFSLVRASRLFREKGRRTLADPDQRRDILAAIGGALRAGRRLQLEQTTPGGNLRLTLVLEADAMRRLAALVDEWGDKDAAAA